MQIVTLFLNAPWSFLGSLCAVLSGPRLLEVNRKPFAFIVHVRSFWWYTWMPSKRGTRAMTHGNIVLIGKNEMKGDREHELVHVEQYQRMPFIHPYLYAYESGRYGYMNKYEIEAYRRAGNEYVTVPAKRKK